MSPRSVLALFPRSSGGQRGGIEQSARLANEALAARTGFETRSLEIGPVHSDVGPTWKLMASISLLLDRREIDTLLVWHPSFLKLLPFVGRRPRQIVTFLHGKEVWGELPKLVLKGLSSTDLLLTNSVHTWERFVERHPVYENRPHRTVHLGIGEPASDAVGPPGSPASAIMLGRLHSAEDYKGHREVIEAWPQLLKRIPEARLVIVGEGSLLPDLMQQALQLGLRESIAFEGGVDEIKKNRSIAGARCLVLPSRGEGFGLVYLEAMRLGRPCLVSDADAGREVVGSEGGIAVDPDDRDAVVDGLERLLRTGSDWDALSQGARARYERDFTASAFQRRLIDVLEEAR